MDISREQFERLVSEAVDNLPENVKEKINNVAILVEDEPTQEQLKKVGLKKTDLLYGLFEGYCQAKKLNFGPVLPDRITIFRLAIASQCASPEEIKNQVESTVRHEIAHHFGSDEVGARRAGKK